MFVNVEEKVVVGEVFSASSASLALAQEREIVFSRVGLHYRIVGFIQKGGFDAGIAIVNFFQQKKVVELKLPFFSQRMKLKNLENYSPLDFLGKMVVLVGVLIKNVDVEEKWFKEMVDFVKDFLDQNPNLEEIQKKFGIKDLLHDLEKQHALDVLKHVGHGEVYDY